MPRLALLALPAVALLASGCVSTSHSSAVRPLSADLASTARVAEITLRRDGDIKVTPEFDSLFKSLVQKELDKCATGSRPLRLEASITSLDKANPAMTLLIAGKNAVRGHARLVDAQSGKVVGEYEIGQTVVGSRLAIIQMSEAEEQVSKGFGREVCKQAFPAK
jgi:hypothetical protein